MALNNLKEAQAYIENLEEIRNITLKKLLESKALHSLKEKEAIIDSVLKEIVAIAGRNDPEMSFIDRFIKRRT